jgi:hypothetical protein
MKNKIAWPLIVFLVALISVSVVFRSKMFRVAVRSSISAEKVTYHCPMHPNYTSERPGDCAICGMKLVKTQPRSTSDSQRASMKMPEAPKEFTLKELLAMKPGEICLLHKCKMGTCMIAMTEEFARLGKCPHCGEDLGIIIKDFLPKGRGSLALSPEKQQLIGVKTALVKKMPMTKTIRTSGRIAYDPDLYQAEEEYIQALEAANKAKTGTIEEIKVQALTLVDSAKTKLKLMGLNDALIQDIEQAGKPDRSLLYAQAGQPVWLYATLYEYEVPLVKVGEPVTVDSQSLPGRVFQGAVQAIDSVLDPTTRSVRVRAKLENSDGILKPEMYVNAALQINLGEVIAVPSESVFSSGEQNIIFISKPGGLFEPRAVTLGVKSDSDQEIKSGVTEGESVVVSGNFLIDSESQLKGALENMGGGGQQHGQSH